MNESSIGWQVYHLIASLWGAVMSDRTLEVGQLSAGRGEKRYSVVEFLVQGQSYRLPVWLINGNEAGPTLVVTGGVHGAEYASIAAA